MNKDQSREKNGFWKGGRSVASNGYVLIKVGFDHHLADVRGYAYEHRLVAEHKIGRRLRDGEQVHHIDHDKANNNPDNLMVAADAAHHHLEHRIEGGVALQMPDEPNRMILCGCGCGTELALFDDSGRPRNFITGHNNHGSVTEAETICALATRPMDRAELAAVLGAPTNVVASRLSKLKNKGIAINDANGLWKIGGRSG